VRRARGECRRKMHAATARRQTPVRHPDPSIVGFEKTELESRGEGEEKN
jgi:hypothetical protein